MKYIVFMQFPCAKRLMYPAPAYITHQSSHKIHFPEKSVNLVSDFLKNKSVSALHGNKLKVETESCFSVGNTL